MDKNITCFFTGNREIPQNEYDNLAKNTEKAIRDMRSRGYENFIAGGALGFDTLAAKTVLSLRGELGIKLYMVLPCADQAKYFSPSQLDEYEQLKSKADGVYVMYEKYVRGCMHARNRKMANNSTACIAYDHKPTGGTKYTVDYAKKRGIYIIYL